MNEEWILSLESYVLSHTLSLSKAASEQQRNLRAEEGIEEFEESHLKEIDNEARNEEENPQRHNHCCCCHRHGT